LFISVAESTEIFPARVSTGLLGRRASHGRRLPIQERAARGGQQQTPHPDRSLADTRGVRQTLEDGVVFAVNRDQGGSAGAGRGQQQRACHDHGLFVGDQQPLARRRCGDG
jgi:hypothetical protein